MIYLINMSKGDAIKIDEQDLTKIKANISEKLIAVKQAIINPSFMISIVPTEEKEFVDKKKVILKDGRATLIEQTDTRALVDKMNNIKELN